MGDPRASVKENTSKQIYLILSLETVLLESRFPMHLVASPGGLAAAPGAGSTSPLPPRARGGPGADALDAPGIAGTQRAHGLVPREGMKVTQPSTDTKEQNLLTLRMWQSSSDGATKAREGRTHCLLQETREPRCWQLRAQGTRLWACRSQLAQTVD